MKKVLFTLVAVVALTVASKYMTAQAEEMAGTEAAQAVVENMVNEAVNEMNEMNAVEDMNAMNAEMNEVVEGAGAASAETAQ